MDRGAWWTTVCGVAKVSDRTEQVNSKCTEYAQWARDCAKLLKYIFSFPLYNEESFVSWVYRWGNRGSDKLSGLSFDNRG